MIPDPTPPYCVSDFCPQCREKFLQAMYQRRLSSLLAGRK